MTDISTWLNGRLAGVVHDAVDPFSRVSAPHWALAAGFALLAYRLYVARGRLSLGEFVRYLAPAAVWRHGSVLTDVKVYLFNALFEPARLLLFGASAAVAATGVAALLTGAFGAAPVQFGSGPVATLALGVLMMLAIDLSSYVNHRLAHQVPALWAFHRVHHSAEVLTPLTLLRKHPVYDVASTAMDIVIVAPIQGLLLYFWGAQMGAGVLVVVNVGFLLFGLMAGALRHSHVWLSFGPVLNRLVISPAMHQIHHSTAARHWNRNYGEVFAVWDVLFATAYLPREKEELAFGLGEPQPHPGLRQALLEPFAFAAARLAPRPEPAR